jgi:hypothetical protein
LEFLEPRTLLSNTWYVDSSFSGNSNGSQGYPFTTIQAGINAAHSGDTILVEPGIGYHEADTIVVSNLTIEAATGTSPVLDGSGLPGIGFDSRSFTSGLTISGMTIQNFSVSGGIDVETGPATITNDTITGNGFGIQENQGGNMTMNYDTINGNGNGVVVGNGVTTTITNGTLETSWSGAGILNAGTLSVAHCTIAKNSDLFGGIENDGNGTLSITSSTIEANSALSGYVEGAGWGGGIGNIGALTVTDCTIAGNMAVGRGGGIYNGYPGTVTVTGSTISGNSTTGDGGGIWDSGTVTVTNSAMVNNLAGSGSGNFGGGIDNNGGTATVTNSTITSNSTTGDGGGIYNYFGTLTVSGATIGNNSAAGAGGGIDTHGGSAIVTGATIGNNSAVTDGGGIWNSGTVTVTNSTIADNSASYGGGIFNDYGTLTAVNSTVAYNEIPGGGSGTGGGLDVVGGTATLDNTIVVLNTDGTGHGAPADDIAGAVASASASNLIGTGGAGGLTTGSNGNQVGVAHPGLGALASNGGPTQTIALVRSSPAIDAGSNALAVDAQGNPLTTDQRGRGFPRIVNGVVDIGAFEAHHATTTAVVSSANPSVYGQSVTFTATVTAADPGFGAPTGSVTFRDGSTTLGTGTLAAGIANFTTTKLATRHHAITAVYSGDSTFATSTSAALSQIVNQDGTTTAVIASVSPSVFGQSVTVTATVSAMGARSGTPTGTVTFYNGTTALGTGRLNSSGRATFATKTLAVGTHAIMAVYGGNANFTTSSSTALTQTVNQDGTTTTVTSSKDPSVYGQSVMFTATVKAAAPGSGTPTGLVTFLDGTTTLGTATLSSTGTATFTTSSLSTGTHVITAVHRGDLDFKSSTSMALKQVVNHDGTTTSVVSSANPSVSGQAVTFTAPVTAAAPGSGTPTGIVTFYDSATVVGTATLSGGTATFTTESLAVGTHRIKVVYGGDSNFNACTSAVLNQVVKSTNSATLVSIPSAGKMMNRAGAAILASPSTRQVGGKTEVPVSLHDSSTALEALDRAIEMEFVAPGLVGNNNTMAVESSYELDIILPNGQTPIHHFDRLLGDFTGDRVVDHSDLDATAASIGQSSPSGVMAMKVDGNGDGSVTAFGLTLATRSKSRKLRWGISPR